MKKSRQRLIDEDRGYDRFGPLNEASTDRYWAIQAEHIADWRARHPVAFSDNDDDEPISFSDDEDDSDGNPVTVAFTENPTRSELNMFDTEREERRARTLEAVGLKPPEKASATVAEQSTGDPFRDRTRAWGRAQNESVRPAEAPSAATSPSYAYSSPEPPKDLFLGDPEVIRHARSLLGPVLFEAKALESRRAIPECHSGMGFVAAFAAESHRARALLAAVAAGQPIDLDAIDAEAAVEVLRDWFSMPRASLEILASGALRYQEMAIHWIKQLDSVLEFHGSQLRIGGSLQAYTVAVGPTVTQRATLLRKAREVAASLAALAPAVAARVKAAIDRAGGSEAVATAVREGLMSKARWPGPDYDLATMEVKLREAAERMTKFRTADPDRPEGPMAAAARADRDSLLPLVENRRIEVERAALTRIDAMLADALRGDVSAFAELAAMVAETPGAFPAGLGAALQSIPLDAALAAGPAGFSVSIG